ncbi:MAG: dNTP triphosphohydrolase, partial [Bacteroidetes bacterium]|nr:dNTP triphosphohydrolase [Bacteroidota bacterium]
MEWIELLNSRRFRDKTTKKTDPDARSEFQRDIDRVLFSTQFRRMGDKTQVFPIPNSDFVHNRLTHSLEVASSGKSLGMLAGNFILKQKEKSLFRNSLSQRRDKFIPEDFANIVHAACLAHDIGNPPFGHSGEKAIAHFFLKDSSFLDRHLSEGQALDLKNFEGNASGFRLLTTNNYSGFPGGLRLTYATLGTYSKYPWDSSAQHNVGQKEVKSD